MRLASAFALVALLMQLLYLPSRHDAHELSRLLALEHTGYAGGHGASAANAALARAALWRSILVRLLPLPAMATPADTGQTAITAERAAPGSAAPSMDALQRRLLGNAYFRAVHALLLLWLFRLAVLWHWSACLVAWALACAVDAWVARQLRRAGIRPEHPERFAITALGCVACLWTLLALSGWPAKLAFEGLATLAVILIWLVGQCIAWRHILRA